MQSIDPASNAVAFNAVLTSQSGTGFTKNPSPRTSTDPLNNSGNSPVVWLFSYITSGGICLGRRIAFISTKSYIMDKMSKLT